MEAALIVDKHAAAITEGFDQNRRIKAEAQAAKMRRIVAYAKTDPEASMREIGLTLGVGVAVVKKALRGVSS